MKRPGDVGKDFDEYAKVWTEQQYELEVKFSAEGLVRDGSSTEVQRPGDEWGEAEALRRQYAALIDHLNLPDTVSVLEIGAGGGRSTAVLLDVLGDRAGRYHVIDVADGFVDTLRARVTRELDIHIVSDVDVSMIESGSIDLVLAQSSWSHISLYDQYRYLRDLRRVLKHRAPIVVSGLFLLGVNDDWTWNRFRRRVHQIDADIQGVYHEFTSISAVAEMLGRLGYEDATVLAHGFVARRGRLTDDRHHARLPDGFSVRYSTGIDAWLSGGGSAVLQLPPGAATTGPASARRRAAVVRTRLVQIRRGLLRRVRAFARARG